MTSGFVIDQYRVPSYFRRGKRDLLKVERERDQRKSLLAKLSDTTEGIEFVLFLLKQSFGLVVGKKDCFRVITFIVAARKDYLD